MSNIFLTIEALQKFSEKPKVPQDQKEFILSLLDGDGLRPSFLEIVQNRDNEGLKALCRSIEEKISTTPGSNFAFRRLLKKTLKDIKGVLEAEDILADIGHKEPKRLEKYKKVFDSLYLGTEQRQGTVMMPIMQAMDARLGDSQGECFGYIADWAAQLMKNQAYLGQGVDEKPIFERVSINSKTWERYPDLNHLARLNSDISFYQRVQASASALSGRLSGLFAGQNQKVSFEQKGIGLKFYTSPAQIAEKLVQKTENEPEKIYNLNVMGYMAGHALGFCKMKEQYHFMDSNSGWFRFENAEDFKAWLPFYFKKIGYDKMFAEYQINTYALEPEETSEKKVLKEKDEQKDKKLTVALLIIFFPIALLVVGAILFNHIVIRGFRYAHFHLKNCFQKDQLDSVPENQLPIEEPEIEPLPSGLDYLDLAQPEVVVAKLDQAKPEAVVRKENSSAAKMNALLDLPLKDLTKAQRRSELNEEFISHKKTLFAQAPVEHEVESQADESAQALTR